MLYRASEGAPLYPATSYYPASLSSASYLTARIPSKLLPKSPSPSPHLTGIMSETTQVNKAYFE